MWELLSRPLRLHHSSFREIVSTPAAQVIAGLTVLAGVLLVVPLGTPGCVGPAFSHVKAGEGLPTFLEPARNLAELKADDDAIAAASAQVRDRSNDLADADVLQAHASDARSRAQEAASTSWDIGYDSYGLGSDWSVTNAELDVGFAETSVTSAESWVTTMEDIAATSRRDGYGSSTTDEMLQDAKDDLASARTELADAESALATAQVENATAEQEQDSAQASADRLGAEADAAEQAADVAMSTAVEALASSEARLTSAQNRDAEHTASHRREVAMAFSEHRALVGSIAASNVALSDCRANTHAHLVAAAVLGVTSAAIAVRGLLPFTGRRRTA